MKMWIGAAIVTVAFLGGVANLPAAAAPSKPSTPTADSRNTTEFSARHHRRRYDRHGYQPQPHYYARPYYYRPYPYSTPAPFTFGFGFGPGWW